jgi:hypothetical protein
LAELRQSREELEAKEKENRRRSNVAPFDPRTMNPREHFSNFEEFSRARDEQNEAAQNDPAAIQRREEMREILRLNRLREDERNNQLRGYEEEKKE